MPPASTLLIDWNKLQTGDLLLFHGEDYWFSYVIEWGSWSDFSHIAMVVRDPTYIDPDLKGLYMLESGAERFPDAVHKRIEFGVQIVDLKEVIENYSGQVYVRSANLNQSLRTNLEQTLTEVWPQIDDVNYDTDPWDFLKAQFGINWGDNYRMNEFFCSALMTFLIEKAMFFNKPVPWDLVRPKDYDDGGKVEKLLLEEITLDNKYLIWNPYSSWWDLTKVPFWWRGGPFSAKSNNSTPTTSIPIPTTIKPIPTPAVEEDPTTTKPTTEADSIPTTIENEPTTEAELKALVG